MKKLKVAIIGIGHDHAIPAINSLKKQSNIFDIAGYVLPEGEKEKFPERMHVLDGIKELDIDTIMNNPEIPAVVIELEDMHLAKYALLAAEHKKHIQMDKPGGTSLDEFEKLIKTVKQNNVVFHTGYMYRYNPFITEAIEKVKSGVYGNVISVEAQMNCKHNPDKRQWLSNFPGGMMFYLGCHLIDLVLQLQGQPERIIPLNKCSGLDGVTGEDFGMAVFEYKNGVSFVKTTAVEKGGYARRQLVINCEKGTVEIKPLEMQDNNGNHFTEQVTYTSNDWFDRGAYSKSDMYDRYDDMLADFVPMVYGEKENPFTPDYELELYKTLLKCCGKYEL